MIKTWTTYLIVTSFLGDHPNSYDTVQFDNKKDAENHWREHYLHRNKQDGHDEYWRKTPLVVLKETTSREIVVDERPRIAK